MGRVYGYARVSSTEQELSSQVDILVANSVKHIFKETVSGTSTEGRDKLKAVLELLEADDTLVVTRIDRLARSIVDLKLIVDDLEKRGVKFRCTEQPVDTSTAAGKAFLGMLGVFAEFETELRAERQKAGVQRAKAAGKYKGRAPTALRQQDRILELKKKGHTVPEIVQTTGISKSSIYRILSAAVA